MRNKGARIIPHPTKTDGSFTYQYDESKQFSFGGIDVKKSEALVRLGVMPDNNLITNKVINILGRRVLDMMRDNDPNRPRTDSRFVCQTAADQAELLGLWVMQDVLSKIKPLETLTGFSQKSGKDRQKKIAEINGELLELKKELKGYFAKQLGGLNGFSQELDNRLQTLIDATITHIHGLNPDEMTTIEIEKAHRDLLRHMMNEFEKLQAYISGNQLDVPAFSIANSTNTNATQIAYYAIQNHTYSANGCKESQLWIPEKETGGLKKMDTTQYPSMRQDDALFVAALIESFTDTDKASAQKIDSAKTNYETHKKEIQTQHGELKLEIDKARGGIGGALGIGRDAAVATAFAPPEFKEKSGWSNWDAFKKWLSERTGNPELEKSKIKAVFEAEKIRDELKKPYLKELALLEKQTDLTNKEKERIETLKKILNNLDRQYKQYIPPKKTDPAAVNAFEAENAAYVYKPGDVLSAISNFAYEFGEYFSREMAAKHPGVTTVGFAIPSAYFATIALSSAHVAPHIMHAVYTNMSKLLTFDGKLTNPHAVTQVFKDADSAWMWLTKCHGTLETIIMTGFGEPKMTFLLTEQINKAITGVPDTTIQAMARAFSAGNLNTNIPIEEARQKVQTVLKVAMLLGLASGLGIGAAAMPALPGLKVTKGAVEIFDNVQASTFTAIVAGQTGLIELGRIAQMLAEVKTAGLFIGKLMGIGHFLRQGHEKEDQAAFQYFSALKEQYEKLPDDTERHKLINSVKNTPDYQHHRKILEQNVAEKPQNKALFGDNLQKSMQFLNDCGMREIKKAPAVLSAIANGSRMVGGSAAAILRGIPGAAYVAKRKLFNAKDPVPNGKVAKGLYKDGAKLILNTSKIVTMAWLGAKFFGQAAAGFVGRIVIGAARAIKEIPSTVVQIAKRIKAYPDGNVLGYLGNQGTRILRAGSGLVSLVGKAIVIATSPAIALGGLMGGLALSIRDKIKTGQSHFKDNMTYGFKTAFKTSWKATSAPKEALTDRIVKFEQTDFMTQKEAGEARMKAELAKETANATPTLTATDVYLNAKNGIGDLLSEARDKTLRTMAHDLQVVKFKEELEHMKGVELESLKTAEATAHTLVQEARKYAAEVSQQKTLGREETDQATVTIASPKTKAAEEALKQLDAAIARFSEKHQETIGHKEQKTVDAIKHLTASHKAQLEPTQTAPQATLFADQDLKHTTVIELHRKIDEFFRTNPKEATHAVQEALIEYGKKHADRTASFFHSNGKQQVRQNYIESIKGNSEMQAKAAQKIAKEILTGKEYDTLKISKNSRIDFLLKAFEAAEKPTSTKEELKGTTTQRLAQ